MPVHKVTFLPMNVTVEVDDEKYPLADHGKPGSVLDIADWRSPSTVITSALARYGRAFGAALAADFARSGRYDPRQHDGLTDSWPFEHWGKAQRGCAPPIVARCAGENLRVGDRGDQDPAGERHLQ